MNYLFKQIQNGLTSALEQYLIQFTSCMLHFTPSALGPIHLHICFLGVCVETVTEPFHSFEIKYILLSLTLSELEIVASLTLCFLKHIYCFIVQGF